MTVAVYSKAYGRVKYMLNTQLAKLQEYLFMIADPAMQSRGIFAES